MNKGKPSGFKADTKKDAGVKSSSRPRRGQAGAGPEWTKPEASPANGVTEAPALRAVREGNGATEAVNPFPEIRNGASTNGAAKSQVIRFELTDGNAQKVCIAGSFNDWHPEASEMIRMGDGQWWKELSL